MNIKLEKPSIDFIELKQIDNAVDTLITNDVGIISDSKVAPTVWCCKWYNSLSKTGLMYNKGDAVWINTEDVETYVIAHRQYIENIINNDSTLRLEYKKYSNTESEKIEFLKKVATEPIYGTQWDMPLYYFGDLTGTTQIRVSTIDNNDMLPNNNLGWKDFFIDASETTVKSSIMSAVSDSCERYLSKHLADYHLSGISQYWYNKYVRSGIQLSDEYLLRDMSNIDNEQEYQHLQGTSDKGFDYVIEFHQKKYSDDCWKWFRVWNSGFIEHGGVVSISKYTLLGDTMIQDDESLKNVLYQVNLGWTDADATAPIFQYSRSSDNWYSDETIVRFDNASSIPITGTNNLVKYNNRYLVSVTPIADDSTNGYSIQNQGTAVGIQYVSRDVFNMTDSSFQFVIDSGYDRYSYYASGYAKNIRWSYV